MNANTKNKYLEEERTVYGSLSNKDVNVKLHIFGLLIYIIFFIYFIIFYYILLYIIIIKYNTFIKLIFTCLYYKYLRF